MVKPADTPDSDERHFREAVASGRHSESQSGGNREVSVACVISLFLFKLSGGYVGICFITFCLFKIFHNSKH